MQDSKGIVRHIQTATDPTVSRLFRGPDKGTYAISFDPHMRQIAAAGADGLVHVYPFKPQGREFKFVGHLGPVLAVAFSPNGEIIASGGEDRTLKLWKNNIYGKCHSIRGHLGSVKSLSFSACGSIIISSSDDKTIKGFNVAKHKFKFSLPGHTNWVRSAKLAPDARLVVSGSDDCSVRLWDVEISKELQKFKESSSAVYAVDWISDGTTVCGSTADGKLNLWDVRSMKLIQHYEIGKSAVNSISVHPSGCYLTSGDESGALKIYDLRQGLIGWSLYSHKSAIKSVVFNKAGDYFASSGLESSCLVWKTNFDDSIAPYNVVNFIDNGGLKQGMTDSQYNQSSNLITQTTFKANKTYQHPVSKSQLLLEQQNEKVVYKTPKEKKQEEVSVALSGKFEKIVNQLDKITELIVSLDTRISNTEGELKKLYKNPKAISCLKKYEELFQEPYQRQAVWENYSQQLRPVQSTQKEQNENKQNQQSFQEDFNLQGPIFGTGSFIRQELVEDYPDESDKKLQEEYESDQSMNIFFNQTKGRAYGDSPTLTLQGPNNQFYGTNPFQSGALSSTFNQQFQQTVQQTFSTRMNLQEQLGNLGDWRSQLEGLQNDIAEDRNIQQNEQIIREAQEIDEEEDSTQHRQFQFDQEPQNEGQQQGGQLEDSDDDSNQDEDYQGNQGEEEQHQDNQNQHENQLDHDQNQEQGQQNEDQEQLQDNQSGGDENQEQGQQNEDNEQQPEDDENQQDQDQDTGQQIQDQI